ncbi:nuclear transport factor 2 family protein [Micromonospora sp. SD19]
MARYVRYADHHRWQDLAGLFTPNGTSRTTLSGRGGRGRLADQRDSAVVGGRNDQR